MQRLVVIGLVVLGSLSSAAPLLAQSRPAEPPRSPGSTGPSIAPGAPVPPGDEIKLDEAGSLKAVAIQSRLSAIVANAALLQRQLQDLQTEWAKALEERRKIIDEAAKKSKVEVREATEWLYDEGHQRYVRNRKKP